MGQAPQDKANFKTMINTIKSILIILTILTLTGCVDEKEELYAFFVAGHTYGGIGIDNAGLHPPFKAKYDFIKDYPAMNFGVLTGDIVHESTVKDWDEVDADMNYLGLKVHFAAGNHDVRNRTLFETRYGSTYYSFKIENDLCIVLDPNLDQWHISGDQLIFLKNTLVDNAESVDNIFVFHHQVLWWAPDNAYNTIKINSHIGRADNPNFWTEIEPLFHALENPVYFFAGDVGGASWTTNCSYDAYDNIHFITSGMGAEKGEDNFLIVKVSTEKEVTIELIALEGNDINAMGNIEDY